MTATACGCMVADVKYRSDGIDGPTTRSETIDALEFLARLATHIDSHREQA